MVGRTGVDARLLNIPRLIDLILKACKYFYVITKLNFKKGFPKNIKKI